MKHLSHYICLTILYDYLVIFIIHTLFFLLFVVFSNKVYAPVSLKVLASSYSEFPNQLSAIKKDLCEVLIVVLLVQRSFSVKLRCRSFRMPGN